MTTNDIRSKFLSFFKSKEHAVIASDSLVPKDDPTVLFTTAGMQQFKPQFLGRLDGFDKAVTCQKCLRTDDLDCVGKTDAHHTFFEMLGNFSFGDYFKTQAIHWAWEFLTVEMKLPKEKLWVSVYIDDEEAYLIWRNDIQIPLERLVKLGDKSNFWPSNARLNGPNGPCGPCSEIFYDYGNNPNCSLGSDCNPDCSCGRFSEIWNLVFTQFNRKEDGTLEPLPAKNIDTGMGLERLAAVAQGKKSNYDTDNWEAILKTIKETFKKNHAQLSESEYRIIADHMRAMTFGICDGVIPSNEGRGYVIRKLIVDSTDLAIRAGFNEPVIHRFVDIVIDRMKEPYPELILKANEIKELIKRIEVGFIKVRRERVPELKKCIMNVSTDSEGLGALFFLFRDTHGLTLTTITAVAREVGVDEQVMSAAVKIFQVKMEEQKGRSRAGSKMTGDVFTNNGIGLDVPKTEFVGYSELEADATVLKVISEGTRYKIILDRTPFYAASGGQVGDSGVIISSTGRFRIDDTQKVNDIYIHEGQLESGSIVEGDRMMAKVDSYRREAITRNHTATHVLQFMLRETLGVHVKQQGSLVDQNRLRFDFTHPVAVSHQEIKTIEEKINRLISNDDPVCLNVLPLEEAKKSGALAFFAEKYGQTVRIVSIGDYSREFCGGTHVVSTGKIESMKIVSEGSVAQGIRRLEAVTGYQAVKEIEQIEKQDELLKNKAHHNKELEKEKQDLRFEEIKTQIDHIITHAIDSKGVKILVHVIDDLEINGLRKLSDALKQKMPSSVLILATKSKENATLLVSVSDDVVSKGIKANIIASQAAGFMLGSGGGRANMAQAGTKRPEMLQEAMHKTQELILEQI